MHNRSLRNQARRKMEQAGRVHKGDGMDLDHVTPLSKDNSMGNTRVRVRPRSDNRSYPRNRRGQMK